MKKKIAFLILSILVATATASAQWQDEGPLNLWSKRPVARITGSEESIYLTDVRVARHTGFDRLVFEFTGGLPSYRITYAGKFDFTGPDNKQIKVKGKSVISINLQPLPYPESEDHEDVVLPIRKARMRSFIEIKETEWFEAVRAFLVGLKAKRPFRVKELTNPYRLVIDFKQ